MNTWTSWDCDTVKGRRDMADDRCVMLWRLRKQDWTCFMLRWVASWLF